MAEINNVNYFNCWIFDKSDRRERSRPNESLYLIKNNTVEVNSWNGSTSSFWTTCVYSAFLNGWQPGPRKGMKSGSEWRFWLRDEFSSVFLSSICCICSLEELLYWKGASDRGRLSTRLEVLLGSLVFICVHKMTVHVIFNSSRPRWNCAFVPRPVDSVILFFWGRCC